MIKELLNVGQENKISKAELLTVTGLTEREFVMQVHTERKNGALILSTTTNGGGYYLPSCDAEIAAFIQSMEHRAANTFIAIKAARAALKEDDAQLTVSDVFGENDNGKGGVTC